MNNLTFRRRGNGADLRLLTLVASGAFCVQIGVSPAQAQVSEADDGTKLVSMCSPNTKCYRVEIKNVSSATVMSTDIIRNSTDGACEKTSIKVKQNSTGNNSVPNKEVAPYIYADLSSKCAYEVKYNVTNGCTGDTRARIKAGKQPSKILLDKHCGTLATTKRYE